MGGGSRPGSLRGLAVLLLAVALGGSALLAQRGSGSTRVPRVHCELEQANGARFALDYFARPFDAAEMRKLRKDPARREQLNALWLPFLGIEFTNPDPLRTAGVEIPAGTHRLALQMSASGALDLVWLNDGQLVHLAQDLAEGALDFSHLSMTLLPGAGGVSLVWQWGPEYGRVEFFG